jgi:hypothetical protein
MLRQTQPSLEYFQIRFHLRLILQLCERLKSPYPRLLLLNLQLSSSILHQVLAFLLSALERLPPSLHMVQSLSPLSICLLATLPSMAQTPLHLLTKTHTTIRLYLKVSVFRRINKLLRPRTTRALSLEQFALRKGLRLSKITLAQRILSKTSEKPDPYKLTCSAG